jgi:hypothetical protein
MGISAFNVTTPSSGDVAGTTGPAELKDIKTQIKASFPAFTTGNDICSLSGPQLSQAAIKNATQTVSAVWNFTAAPTIGGVAVITATSLAALRAYSEFEKTLASGAGSGSKVVLTGFLSPKSSQITLDIGAGTATIVHSGEYELTYEFNAFMDPASSGTGAIGVDRNGSLLNSEVVQLSAIGGVQTQRRYRVSRIFTLTAADVITCWHNNGSGTNINSGVFRLSLRRLA